MAAITPLARSQSQSRKTSRIAVVAWPGSVLSGRTLAQLLATETRRP
jgi:hypothetical protein